MDWDQLESEMEPPGDWSALETLPGPALRQPKRRDPTALVWPPTLPIEIALKTAPMHVIKDSYGFDDDQWEALRYNPVFIKELASVVEALRQDGMSFKLKAKLQAESLLESSWTMIHDAVCPPSVRADLIKSTMRWAGYDNKEALTGQTGSTLQIQINL